MHGWMVGCIFYSCEVCCWEVLVGYLPWRHSTSTDSGIHASSTLEGIAVSKVAVGGAKWVGHRVTACSCLGFKMIHQSVSAFIGEVVVLWSCTDAGGRGWERQLRCVPGKRKQICWPPGQPLIIKRKSQFTSNIPELLRGATWFRKARSWRQLGPKRWTGCTPYIDRKVGKERPHSWYSTLWIVLSISKGDFKKCPPSPDSRNPPYPPTGPIVKPCSNHP